MVTGIDKERANIVNVLVSGVIFSEKNKNIDVFGRNKDFF